MTSSLKSLDLHIQDGKLNKEKKKKTKEKKLHFANDYFSGIMQSQRNKRPAVNT